MACGFACAQIWTLWKWQIPSRVNIASSVNNSFHRNCECRTHCSKHHWQNLTQRDKCSCLRSCARCRWYGYSRSSCSILQTVLRWTPSAADIVRVLNPGLAATWGRIRCSCYTVLAVRGLPPLIVEWICLFSADVALCAKMFGYMEVDDSEMFLDTAALPHVHCRWHDCRRSECLPSQQTYSLWPTHWIRVIAYPSVR